MNCLGDWNPQFLIHRSIYQKRRILRSWGWRLCYFLSFVQAQYYGLELLPFSQSLVNQLVSTRNFFTQSLFRLPPGTSSELFYMLWPSFTPQALYVWCGVLRSSNALWPTICLVSPLPFFSTHPCCLGTLVGSLTPFASIVRFIPRPG